LDALGEEVRARRNERDLTQEELALEIDMNTNALGRLERGETDFRMSTLIKIASGLQISLTDLVRGAERRWSTL
jgi:XRE family transcriptional regulator, regulator of sulfur utilization